MTSRLRSLYKSILLFTFVVSSTIAVAQVGIYQAVSQKGSSSSTGITANTWSLECGGSSPEVILLVHYTGFSKVSALYNGNSNDDVTNTSANSDNIVLFYFHSPTPGLNTIELDVKGTGTFYADALALQNVDDNSVNIDVFSNSSGSSATITESGSGANDMILGGVLGNLGTITVPASANHQQSLLGPFTSPYVGADGYVMSANTDKLTWDFSNSGNNTIWATRIRGASPLPISLLSFNAAYLSSTNSVLVKWSTATETDNKLFTIEKTTDGTTYTEVATTPGAGNSDQTLNYSIVDETPTAGTSYYRLKQTDYDGNYTYSNLSAVTIEAIYDVTLAPNPVGNATTLRYSSNSTEPLNVRIYDMSGQLVSEYNYSEVQAGENNFSINTSALSQGTYIMQLVSGTQVTNRKFVK